MIVGTDKTNHLYNYIFWFIHVFFSIKYLSLLILNSLLVYSTCIFSQCPDKDFFKEKILAISNSPINKTDKRLNILLQLQQQMRACHVDRDSSFMLLLQKLGVIYFTQADYPNAIKVTKQAINIANECITNHSCNTLALVHNYSNLYYYYDKTGDSKNKYDAVDSCILYALAGGSGFDMAIEPLSEKTEYLFNKGEYNLCSRNAKLGENIIQKYYRGKDSIIYTVFFIMKQANAMYFSKNTLLAESLLENKIQQFKETGNSKQVYAFYSLLGLINYGNKHYSKALIYFQNAYRVSLIVNYRQGCAQNLAFLGRLYAKNFNRPNKGLEYCAEALKYADEATDSLSILKQIANIYVLKGMYDKTQYFFQQAYNTVHSGINETTFLQNSFQFPGFNLLQNLSDLTTDKGNSYLQQYYHTKNDSFLNKALSIYKKGDLFLAKIKNEQQLQLGSNLIWRTTARNLYEHAIEACYTNKNIEDAFYFFEKSRAILLNDQINEQRWMADEDVAKQANIKKTIIELERDLSTVHASSEEYLTIQKKLYSSSQELEVLTRNIRDKNPAFYKNYLDTVFISVAELRKNILNNSKALVEIFSGEDAVYVLTITPNDQSFTKINKQLYDSLTNSFNSFITNRELLNKNFTGFVTTAHQLYNLLFQSIPVYSSIIISPDGISFPFEALVINKDGQQPDYFLNHYAASYTYSIKYLTNRFALNKNASNNVLGIAPVQYNNQNLATLTGSDNSLKNITKYFSGTTSFVLEKATRSNFLKNFPRFNIIQLYTHASDSSINNEPVIYFSDSALYLSDLIPDTKSVTQLVILSACETAKGKIYEGEGTFSFNRGFAALGIPAAISNLWSVENESTYLITELFYKYLSQGLTTDVALQKAKVEFINNSSTKEKKLPFFWAGSILTGKVDTIKGNGKPSWLKYIGGATMLLLATAYVTTRKSIRAAK